MKEIWLKLKPGGHLLLAVPVCPMDRFMPGGARCYGPTRLPMLAKGWEYHGAADVKSQASFYGPNSTLDLTKLWGDADWFSTQSVLVLGKPEDAPETLEQMQQELAKGSRDRLGFICDKRLKICGRR